MSEQYWKQQAELLAFKNKQLRDALDTATKDLVAYQINARNAMKRDILWDGVPEIIQPTIDSVQEAIGNHNDVDEDKVFEALEMLQQGAESQEDPLFNNVGCAEQYANCIRRALNVNGVYEPDDYGIEFDEPTNGVGGEYNQTVSADWLWVKLMEWCRDRGVSPVHYNDLFSIVKQARQETPND